MLLSKDNINTEESIRLALRIVRFRILVHVYSILFSLKMIMKTPVTNCMHLSHFYFHSIHQFSYLKKKGNGGGEERKLLLLFM